MIQALDLLGAIFSFLSTVCYVLALEFCWPLGVVATVLNGTLYGLSHIYGDMVLEMIYFVLMFFGWYEWRYGGRRSKRLRIAHLNPVTGVKLVIIAALSITVTYTVLKFYLGSVVPGMDSVTTVLSLVAQGLMCFKIIETWVVWFIVDAIYVVLYFSKALPVHSLLLLAYLGMAIAGYWRWHVLMQKKTLELRGLLYGASHYC